MENQTDQQQETHGKTAKPIIKQVKKEDNDNTILSPETSVLIQPRLRALLPGLQAFSALGAEV